MLKLPSQKMSKGVSNMLTENQRLNEELFLDMPEVGGEILTAEVDTTLAELAKEIDGLYTEEDEVALGRKDEQKFPGGTDDPKGRKLDK
jgi:hypothetical protein